MKENDINNLYHLLDQEQRDTRQLNFIINFEAHVSKRY